MSNHKPIRILQVLSGMNRAGAETMLMNLYRSIDRNRVQFDFAVTAMEQCDYDNEIKSLGGIIYHYPRYTGINHFSYEKWWNDFFSSHPEYHIIHGHIGSTASIYLAIAKRYGCFTIAHSHNTSGAFSIKSLLYKVYSYSTRYIADYFIGCSYAALVSRYGKKVAQNHSISSVLNNGIDVKEYTYSDAIRQDVIEELKLTSEELICGTVGRLVPQKNPLFILDILVELKKRNSNFTFLWVGTGDMKKEIEDIIRDTGLQKNVLLLGVRNDIPRILQALNVFILPSQYEGLPVIGVEVQAAGVPMLCSDKVSSEVMLSKCCKFLPIDSVEPWVDEILKEKNFRRVDNAPTDVIKAGYDIQETSIWLMEFYEKNW